MNAESVIMRDGKLVFASENGIRDTQLDCLMASLRTMADQVRVMDDCGDLLAPQLLRQHIQALHDGVVIERRLMLDERDPDAHWRLFPRGKVEMEVCCG